MNGKTPVSVLQELCMRKHHGAPYYDLVADGKDESKTFAYVVEAFGQSARGQGKAKKDAKHEAAVNILSILKTMDEHKYELEGMAELTLPRVQSGDGDSVGLLLDLCVQREWPIAVFTVQQAFGAPHAPEFTVECRVASITRVGTFSTKKGAKQIAAQEMLNVIQQMSNDYSELQVATLNDYPPETHIKTYREMKNSDIKIHPGTLLSDRHKFFQNMENAQKEQLRKILFDLNETPKEKVHLLCMELNWKYNVSQVKDHPSGNMYLFELRGVNYDVVLTGTVPTLYEDILNYLKMMSGVVNNSRLYI